MEGPRIKKEIMKKPKVYTLPVQIFVYWTGIGEDRYLAAQETVAGISPGQVVGVYKLSAVKNMKVTEELV